MSLDPAQLQMRLANERTFLAWIRTAVALMGFGVMIARLGVFLEALQGQARVAEAAPDHSRAIGISLIIVGSLVVTVGYLRLRAHARTIAAGGAPPGDTTLLLTGLLVVLLGVGLAIFIGLIT